jgi:hypothetical protein
MSTVNNVESLNKATEKLLEIIKSDNLSYQKGDFFLVDVFELCNQGKLNECFGNNSSPYFACVMPKSPDQPAKVPNFVEVTKDRWMSFRLGFNEAIVLTGMTPPKATTYFSYSIFLSSRRADNDNEAVNNITVTPLRNKPVKSKMEFQRDKSIDLEGELPRDVLFSCLGEPLNQLKINTPGSPGNPFSQPFLIVLTANQDLQQTIYKLALQAGFSSKSLNTITIPQEIANLGVTDQNSDTFNMLNRISSLNKNDQEFQNYLNNPGVQVLRVISKNTGGKALPMPFLTPRGTGKTELIYSKPVETLRNKIVEYYAKDYIAVDITTDIWIDESHIAIQQGFNNLGESRDTVYLGSGSFTLPKDAFAVAYGVNHAKTGKCTYSNIVVYGNQYDNGVASVNNKDLENSALVYLQTLEAGNLYAWRFGYDEDSPYYTQIPTEYNPDGALDTKNINPYQDIYFGFRAYLEPATKVGPLWGELIIDRVLIFLKKIPVKGI